MYSLGSFCAVLLLVLCPSTSARPQEGSLREGRLEFAPAPNCDSVFRQSLPECQAKVGSTKKRRKPYTCFPQATVYGAPGQVWGELTVDVSSPVLFITKPKDLIRKRKDKEREKQEGLSI